MAFSNWINIWGDQLNTTLIKILHDIYGNPSVTKAELSDAIGQGKAFVDNHIATFRELTLIKRVGSRKTGTWKIVQLPNSV